MVDGGAAGSGQGPVSGASPSQLCPQAPSKEGAVKGRPSAGEKPAPARPSADAVRREGPLRSRCHLPSAPGSPPGSRLCRPGSPRRVLVVRDGCRASRCAEG